MMSIRLLFKFWTAEYTEGTGLNDLVGVFVMLMVRAALYLVEACVRSVKFSWLLVVHHVLFFTVVFMGVWTENAATMVIGLTLDCGLRMRHSCMLCYFPTGCGFHACFQCLCCTLHVLGMFSLALCRLRCYCT